MKIVKGISRGKLKLWINSKGELYFGDINNLERVILYGRDLWDENGKYTILSYKIGNTQYCYASTIYKLRNDISFSPRNQGYRIGFKDGNHLNLRKDNMYLKDGYIDDKTSRLYKLRKVYMEI